MKTAIAILFAACLSAGAQFYQLSTNLTATNAIAPSATLTYLGTNYVDVTRYKTVSIAARWSGSNTNTNTATFLFLAGATATNWETLPRFALVATSYGTNTSEAATNIAVLDVGFIKPFQIVNACTNDLTNAVQWLQTKDFTRN